MKITVDNYVPTPVEREIAPEHVEAFIKLRDETFLNHVGVINVNKYGTEYVYKDFVELCMAYGVDATLPEARLAFFRALCAAV